MTNFIDRLIGKRIRALRVARDLASADLASAAGVEKSRLEDYETGRARIPAPEMLALSRVLQVRADAFFADLALGMTPVISRQPSPHVHS
ncbi:MAG: helix-turn-helix domain-containing protein [Rhizobiaceae bacterium]